MCAVGVLYMDDCPVETFIPLYLIVDGAFSLGFTLTSLVVSLYQRSNPECESTGLAKFYNFINMLLCCFLLAWFIAGKLQPIRDYCVHYIHWRRCP